MKVSRPKTPLSQATSSLGLFLKKNALPLLFVAAGSAVAFFHTFNVSMDAHKDLAAQAKQRAVLAVLNGEDSRPVTMESEKDGFGHRREARAFAKEICRSADGNIVKLWANGKDEAYRITVRGPDGKVLDFVPLDPARCKCEQIALGVPASRSLTYK